MNSLAKCPPLTAVPTSGVRDRLSYHMTAIIAACAICTGSVFATPASGQANEDVVPYPGPHFEVDLEKDVRIPMSDGIGLYADIYRPRGAGERLPTILIRTQYNKAPYRERGLAKRGDVAYMFASQGFAVVVQDIRGRFSSGGTFQLAESDVDDGYDTVAWVASQPWSNGKVGGYGCSTLGINQVMMSQRRPPALAAIVPQSAGGALHNNPYDVVISGVPRISSLSWFRETTNQRPQVLEKVDYRKMLLTLPVADMADRAGGAPNDWRDWVAREPRDSWWRQFRFFDENSRPNVPALFVANWYDLPDAALELFNRFKSQSASELARRNQYVILSPTLHCEAERATTPYMAGERNLGDIRQDYWSIYLRWFNHWLRGGQGDINMPHVQYYLMGANRWKSAETWPLPGTQFVPYYFSSSGHANTSNGDGRLSTTMASGSADHYRYDPLKSTPLASNYGRLDGATDQREADLRPDRLVYTTEPLRSGVEVTGPLRAVLYVSSSARDTDFVVQLSDVYPDGRVFDVASGIARARYRDAYTAPTRAQEDYRHLSLLTPGRVYRIEVKVGATGIWFPPGHRIRVQVTSAYFPSFARNLNTGGNNSTKTATVVATNTIYHDQRRPSHIILPIVPQ